MQKSKLTFSNPIIKDRIVLLENSEHKLLFRTFLAPGGGQNQFHYHTRIHETFNVISGELQVNLDNNKTLLKAGSQHTILPHVNHYFSNKSNKPVVFDVQILQPKNMIQALQIMYGLTNDGKTNKDGLPNNIFHTAIGLHMMDAFSPKVPHSIQKIGISTLAFLGKILGIKKRLLTTYCRAV